MARNTKTWETLTASQCDYPAKEEVTPATIGLSVKHFLQQLADEATDNGVDRGILRKARGSGEALGVAEQKRVAERAIVRWWNSESCTLYHPPDDVLLVFMGSVPPHRLKGDMRLKYTAQTEHPFHLFYVTQSPVADTVVISLLGFAPREQLVGKSARPRICELLRDRRHGWDAWRATFPRAVKVQDEVVDEEGMLTQDEIWRIPEETRARVVDRRRLFTFPLQQCVDAAPGEGCSPEALLSRGAVLVAESSWNPTISDEERWKVWDEEAKAGDGVHPAALQRVRRAEVDRAYFYGAVASEIWPEDYAPLRHTVEQSYFRYQMDRGGFNERETATVMLLQRNGLADWLLEPASTEDLALFRELHPGRTEPLLCGWAPVAACPPAFVASKRPVSRGKVRVFYPDVEAMVLRCMYLEHSKIKARYLEYQDHFLDAPNKLGRTAQNLWMHTGKLIWDLRQRALGKDHTRHFGSSSDGQEKAGGSSKIDLDAENLVRAMPPCMRRMVESSQRTPRNLRDGERQWFARFLLDLGYPPSMYEGLIRPNWEKEQRDAKRPTGDSQWKGAWDPRHVWEKKYAKPTCSKIIEQTLEARAPVKKDDKKSLRCECPYARTIKFRNQSSDIETLVSRTTRHCFDEWKKTNPGKVRDHEKALYYPSQYVYLNLRRTRRAHIEIEYEQEPPAQKMEVVQEDDEFMVALAQAEAQALSNHDGMEYPEEFDQ
jgi:hypothetical protein